jgi:hypothetical protein
MPDVRQLAGTVVLLTDMPLEEAQLLVQRTPGIDLVVAGNPEFVHGEAVAVPGTNAFAVVAENPTPRHTGRRVGRLEVTVQADGGLQDPLWRTMPLDASYSDDTAMDALLREYEVPR